jgi:hypothetical protein
LREKPVPLNYSLYDEIPSLNSLRYPIFSTFSTHGKVSQVLSRYIFGNMLFLNSYLLMPDSVHNESISEALGGAKK